MSNVLQASWKTTFSNVMVDNLGPTRSNNNITSVTYKSNLATMANIFHSDLHHCCLFKKLRPPNWAFPHILNAVLPQNR